MKISAVVLTKNNQDIIERCLKTLNFCNEVIVVDDYSSDLSADLAKNLGAIVFKRHLNGDFASQRNFGLRKAKNDCVIFVDSDEEISDKLANEIKSKIRLNKYGGYMINRHDLVWGKTLRFGESGSTIVRIGRKNEYEWVRKVHEYWDIKGKIGVLKNPLIHRAHPTVENFIKNIDYYYTIHASENAIEGKSSNLCKIIIYPILKFTRIYFIKLGILDGIGGFVYATMLSFHSFLAWSHLWITQKRKN